jgi:DNA-binding transcriptional LysR family regulator
VRIDDVRTFLEVATTGSFSAAANRLHVTQPTVSARIQALEEELDRPLFVRGRAGARLSAAGTQFERYAVTLVQAWQQVRGAPTFVRPAYMVYRESAVEHETERIAIEGKRHAASFASEQ